MEQCAQDRQVVECPCAECGGIVQWHAHKLRQRQCHDTRTTVVQGEEQDATALSGRERDEFAPGAEPPSQEALSCASRPAGQRSAAPARGVWARLAGAARH